jgi:hypothetical protein
MDFDAEQQGAEFRDAFTELMERFGISSTVLIVSFQTKDDETFTGATMFVHNSNAIGVEEAAINHLRSPFLLMDSVDEIDKAPSNAVTDAMHKFRIPVFQREISIRVQAKEWRGVEAQA